jgi:hypothetical protein
MVFIFLFFCSFHFGQGGGGLLDLDFMFQLEQLNP